MTPREIVKNYVTELRKQQDLNIYPYDIDTVCDEFNIQNFLFTKKYKQIKLNTPTTYQPRIICLYNKETNKNEYFLVDITYDYFFENNDFKNYMFKHHLEFTKELLNNGFIECTKENFHYYIDGFLNFYKQNNMNNNSKNNESRLEFIKRKKRKKK